MLSDKEKEGFKYVIDNIFKPIVDSHGDKILKILEEDEDLKRRVNEKVQRILENRRKKNL